MYLSVYILNMKLTFIVSSSEKLLTILSSSKLSGLFCPIFISNRFKISKKIRMIKLSQQMLTLLVQTFNIKY